MGMTAPNLHGEPGTEVRASKLFELGGPGQSALSWSFLAASRPPRQLRASFWFWLVAVTAGLFETTLVVIDAIAGEVGSAAGVAIGVTVRLLAFTGLVYLAVRLHQAGRSLLFAASRLVHLAAIIAALILMFHPAANAYIRETRRTRAKRNRA
jgi:hypothetical protein